ncbi:MAG: PaaI family thioesterase [Pseudomonadota bacterium]
METTPDLLQLIRGVNELAAFNRWCGFCVESVEAGHATISMPWRAEAGQYSGFLHAGLVGALIDTACGFAGASVAGAQLLASHFSVNCLRPAVGSKFIARARVVKPGRSQIFTACELYAVADGKETLVATGETLLLVVGSLGTTPTPAA